MSRGPSQLQRIGRRILRLIIDPIEHDGFLGDLDEIFELKVRERGRMRARFWYLFQLGKAIPTGLVHRILWRYFMLRHHLRTALRTFRRQKGYTFINIIGLAIGLACCTMIFQYVRHERSYDAYHRDLERLYRLGVTIATSAGEESYAVTAPAATAALAEHYPQVEHAARVMMYETNRLVRRGDRRFYEEGFLYADADLFRVLTIPFLQGNAEDALVGPDRVVIPRRLADKYFGTLDAVGEVLNIDGRDFTVAGVVEDAPRNTHLRMDLLVSMDDLRDPPWMTDWSWQGMWGYVKLRPGVDPENFGRRIESFADGFLEGDARFEGQSFSFFLTPVRDLYLRSDLQYEPASGNPLSLTIFTLVGLFVLFIACVNFMNLSTAHAMKRSREVGLRKVIGAERGSLVRQFLTESLLLSGMAALLALALAEAARSLFNRATGMDLEPGFSLLARPVFRMLLLSVLAGILGGSYPALMLSSFLPVDVLKHRYAGVPVSGARFRRILVTVQFSVSVFLIVCTLSVFRQLHYMRFYDLGFEKAEKLVIPVRGRMPLAGNYGAMKAAFLRDPLFMEASASSGVPGRYSGKMRMKRLYDGEARNQLMYYESVDEDYLRMYGMKLAAGRTFSESHRTDREAACVINEAAARAFGWPSPEEAVGGHIEIGMFEVQKEVIGVLADYPFRGPRFEIEPQVMELEPRQFNCLSFSIPVGRYGDAVEAAEEIWRGFFPERPLEQFSLDSYFDGLYEDEEAIYGLFRFFSSLGIFIASLGLLGLASFTAEQKRKEIGIRKAVGATSSAILWMLSGEFARRILISNLIAWPLAYAAMSRWLLQFANRTRLSAPLFVFSLVLTLGAAFLTVGWRSVRAARANPVDSLKHE